MTINIWKLQQGLLYHSLMVILNIFEYLLYILVCGWTVAFPWIRCILTYNRQTKDEQCTQLQRRLRDKFPKIGFETSLIYHYICDQYYNEITYLWNICLTIQYNVSFAKLSYSWIVDNTLKIRHIKTAINLKKRLLIYE